MNKNKNKNDRKNEKKTCKVEGLLKQTDDARNEK